MLAVGRALMGGPELLMLDERRLELAPLIVSEVFEALRVLQRPGLTILPLEQNARQPIETVSYAYARSRRNCPARRQRRTSGRSAHHQTLPRQ